MSRTSCAGVLASALGPIESAVGLYSGEVGILLKSGRYGTVITAVNSMLDLVSLGI